MVRCGKLVQFLSKHTAAWQGSAEELDQHATGVASSYRNMADVLRKFGAAKHDTGVRMLVYEGGVQALALAVILNEHPAPIPHSPRSTHARRALI